MSGETEVVPEVAEANGNGEAPEQSEVTAPSAAPEVTESSKEDQAGQPSGQTMFVMNIPTDKMFSFEEELKEIFTPYGEIKAVKQTGIQVDGPNSPDITLSAYVHFSNADAAEKALGERGRNLGGNELDMFVLKTGPNSVVADSLPVTMRTECIRNLLQACGAIKDVVKIPGRRTAFIEFEDEEGAKKALTLNTKLMINNVKIMIEKRDGNSKPVVGHKVKAVVPKTEVRRPFKRPGTSWSRGGFGNAPAPVPVLQQGFRGGFRGGRGQRGAPRGGLFRPPGGYNSGYWGNEFNSNDQLMNKRRKPNDWIRQY